MAKWTAQDIPMQHGRVAIVTGGNSGIGYVTALELARRGADVVVAARSPERGPEAVRRIEAADIEGRAAFMALDLADLRSVREFATRFRERYDRLDLLINNAGIMASPESRTADGFELQIGTNHFGHFALTALLIDRLQATTSSRVVTVSSMAHRGAEIDFDDLHSRDKDYKRWESYGQSKLANLLFSFELQRRLAAVGAPSLSVAAHPGLTATNLQRTSLIARTLSPILGMAPERGALPTLFAATAPSVRGGDYIGPDGLLEARGYPTKVGTAEAARSREDAARLWRISAEATGTEPESLGHGPAHGGNRAAPA